VFTYPGVVAWWREKQGPPPLLGWSNGVVILVTAAHVLEETPGTECRIVMREKRAANTHLRKEVPFTNPLDDRFGGLIDLLLNPERERTTEDYVRAAASYCAAIDILSAYN
jgi:hypothetical protein